MVRAFWGNVAATEGIIMQQATSQQATSQQASSQQGSSPGQAQPSRKRPAIVAGLGAAVIASAVTLVIMMSGSSAPVTVADGASTTAVKECQMTQRKFYVATQTGSGVVRLREGNYLSAYSRCPVPTSRRSTK
jgi:hypothetical protein